MTLTVVFKWTSETYNDLGNDYGEILGYFFIDSVMNLIIYEVEITSGF